MSDGEAKRAKVQAAEDKKAFVALHQSLVDEIIDSVKTEYPDFDADAVQWFRRVLEYNCPGGQ